MAAVILVAGCGGDDESETVASSPTTVTETIPPDPELEGDRPGPPLNAAVKDCAGGSRSSGANVDLSSAQNVRAGPLILYVARQYANAAKSEFSPARLRGYLRRKATPTVRRDIREQSLYLGVKLLLLIEGSRPVTLEVPRAERAHASLLYVQRRGYSPAERRLGLAQVSDGYAAVRFKPCRKGRGPFTEVPGGLVVAGARCLPLDIWVEGQETPIRRTLSFGKGDLC